jgi:hypothetical protein
MSDPQWLSFANEALDEGRPILVTYGSVWASYLVAAAKQLTNPAIWHPDCDVDLAVQYANELICRLIGESVDMPGGFPVSPVTIFPLGLHVINALGTEYVTTSTARYFACSAKTNDSVAYEDWVYFDVYLTPGDYELWFFYVAGPNRGKMNVTSDPDVGLTPVPIDLYHYDYLQTANCIVDASPTDPGVVRITLSKDGKNVASSGGMLYLNAIVLRKV